MYNLSDYDDAKSMYDQRLREAQQHREHNQLVQAALEHAEQENHGQHLNLIQRLLHSRNQPQQENNDARRAPAV
jgi:Trp operon repressor